jgi:hypothetical protein
MPLVEKTYFWIIDLPTIDSLDGWGGRDGFSGRLTATLDFIPPPQLGGK